MKVKPTEVRLVASMLEQEADSAHDLATRIITELDGKRARDNEVWCLLYYDPNVRVYATFGPYSTKGAADRASKALASSGPQPGRAMPLRLREAPG